MTKTTANLTNTTLEHDSAKLYGTSHRLDHVSKTGAKTPSPCIQPAMAALLTAKLQRLLQQWDVYVDDFLGLTQGNAWRRCDKTSTAAFP